MYFQEFFSNNKHLLWKQWYSLFWFVTYNGTSYFGWHKWDVLTDLGAQEYSLPFGLYYVLWVHAANQRLNTYMPSITKLGKWCLFLNSKASEGTVPYNQQGSHLPSFALQTCKANTTSISFCVSSCPYPKWDFGSSTHSTLIESAGALWLESRKQEFILRS